MTAAAAQSAGLAHCCYSHRRHRRRTCNPGALSRAAASIDDRSRSERAYQVEDFARLDLERAARTGFPEVVWGPGKDPAHLGKIMSELVEQTGSAMATRVSPEQFEEAKAFAPGMHYDPISRICTWRQHNASPAGAAPRLGGRLLILAAGTADTSVAKEALQVAQYFGCDAHLIIDVGVAGLHRILSRLEDIQAASVIIVAAGMDGALPSVVAGLSPAPVIAVPTSVGYGASLGGAAALLTALNSCAPGVAVVNIDNGYGAAMLAAKMLRQMAPA